ncbi:MAG: T9SS type A sorting domain-containing protein [Bacteroidota bacterium]|nr:T9SS type A sorting domain-containing protein [Bacteroidota bacterium]
MKKFPLLPFQGIILFIFSVITSEVYAQKANVEKFNFTELANLTKSQPDLRNREEEIDGGWRALHDMPIPVRAKILKQSTAITPFTPNSIESISPPPLQDFLGYIDPMQSIPPDTHGAVGINNVVTATNDFIIVHAKNGGAVLSQMTFATFFNNTGVSDPYMQYDPYLDRYWISGISTENTNKVYIAVSQTGDPTQGWYRQSFTPVSVDGALLLDHPYLGFDNRLLVVSGRKFPGASSFTGTVLFCFDKVSLAAGTPIDFGTNAQTIEKTPTDGDAPCPVTVYGLSSVPASTFYILQNWNGGASAIRLSTVTGNIPTLTWNTSSAVFPVGGTPWADGNLGNLAGQISETRKIAVNDARISSAVMINGQIWCAHHIGLPADNYTHTAVQWWELSTNGTILQRGRIDDSAGLTSRYYPAIAVNAAEDVLIGYTISSPATRINAAYSTRSASTLANTTNDEYIYKGGISTYWKDFGSGRARWGDYSHSVLDPVTGDLWTIQQYAELRAGVSDNQSRYGVWWAEVSFTKFNNDIALSAIIDPNNAAPYCDLPVTPRVTIINVGLDTLKSISIGLILDGVYVGSKAFTNLSLPHFDYQNLSVNLPLSPAAGNHLLKVYTFNPNGITDERKSNDTATISFVVLQTLTLPNVEGFESTTFPPPGGWSLSNPDAGITWARTTQASKSGVASMTLNALNYTTKGQEDILKSPKIDLTGVDSIKINFDVAYSQYSANLRDSLQIVYSTDCGVTWKQTGYRKGGASLSTSGAFITASFVPTANQWRNESVSIPTCGLTASSMVLGIKSVNYHGNNIYVDNFAVSKVDVKQFNASVISINKPFITLCGNDLTPEVTIANNGLDTLKTLKLNYQIDNGPIGTFNFAGTVARCSTQGVTLTPISSIPGAHVLTIFSTEPNGSADQYSFNDTARKSFIISPVLDAPIAEGFETPAFPPANWNVINADGLLTWERTTAAARTGIGAMVIRNFDYPVENTTDKFVSPVVKFDAKVDSFFLSFDYAYAPGVKFPGSSGLPMDTLEVQITQDCGQTFTTIWKKWGADLETIAPAASNGSSFTPTSSAQRKNVNVYLTPIIGTTDFQAYFVAKGNKQNNLYLDNINIYTKTLPQLLKDQGYLIYPNPFRNTFLIRNYRVPTTLQKVSIYNSVGQLVWANNLNGQGYTEMTVDLSNLAKGVYIVKLNYTEKTVVERIVKE